ncbi:MAG: pyridoxamine 5'-phosphate oxidase family protein [Geminicoccales bacterium]
MLELSADEVITSEEGLRARFKAPSELSLRKELDHLDHNCRRFIALSPFLCLATSRKDGMADNSPRGDAPGFVQVLDERTLLIPDRPGNNRLDSLANIVHNPQVGLLFFIPGVTETLRVNGRARLVTRRELLERFTVRERAPAAAILVETQEVFLHCSKALIRSRLWQEDAKVDRKALPSLGQMIAEVVDRQPKAATVAEHDAHIARSIKEDLY